MKFNLSSFIVLVTIQRVASGNRPVKPYLSSPVLKEEYKLLPQTLRHCIGKL
jgi:hypothetical protein